MTTVVLRPDPQLFPAGTTVGAFPRSRWGIALEGAPSGSAVQSVAVAADGTLTYTTLTDGTEYVATAVVSSVRRFLRFTPGPVTLRDPTFVGGYADGEIPIWSDADQRFEPGAGGAGGSVATDAIWNVKGDLAVGSGADAAVRKAAGADGMVLTADSAAPDGLGWKDSLAERKRKLWYPSGQGSAASGATFPTSVIDQSGERHVLTTSQTLASGGARVTGNLFVPGGVTVTGIVVFFGSSANGPTHSFAFLADQALNVLGKSADATTDPLTALAWKTYPLTTPWVAPADTAVYAGFVQTSSTTQAGVTVGPGTINGLPSQPLRLGFNLPGTVTTPADIGSTIAFNVNANPFWVALYS